MVTVLLAVYRGKKYLPALAASLRHQSHADLRVLWQDDGGEAHDFGDGRFLPGAHQGMHLGAAGNFFDLMAQDDSPYAALCDQDDVWHADRLSRCLAAMRQLEDEYGADTPLLVHSDCRLIDGAGHVTAESFFRRQHWDIHAASLPQLLVQNNATGCTMLMNAALRNLVCAHRPGGGVYHDWWIALTAAAFGHIGMIGDALVDYRQHGSNAIGASRSGLMARCVSALHQPDKIRRRIDLTFRMAQEMLHLYSGCLPEESERVLREYESLRSAPKIIKIRRLRRGGYLMQHPLMRLAQIICT